MADVVDRTIQELLDAISDDGDITSAIKQHQAAALSQIQFLAMKINK